MRESIKSEKKNFVRLPCCVREVFERRNDCSKKK